MTKWTNQPDLYRHWPSHGSIICGINLVTLVNLLHLISGYSSFSSLKVFQRSCSLATLILNEFYFLLLLPLCITRRFYEGLCYLDRSWIVLPSIACHILSTSLDPFRGYVFVCYCNIWSCYDRALKEYMMSNTINSQLMTHI